jgi:ribophorin I
MKGSTLFSVVVVLIFAVFAADAAGIVNRAVVRRIDISSQFVKISANVTIRNDGSSTVGTYNVAYDANAPGTLAWVSASIAGTGDQLKVKEGSAGYVRCCAVICPL